MEITTEGLYIIRPLLGDIPAITLHKSSYYPDTFRVFEGPPIKIVVSDRMSVKLMSTSSFRDIDHDYSKALSECLTDIEMQYSKYRKSCAHPIMDNYPAYLLLENLVISGVFYGIYSHGKYDATLTYILGDYGEGNMYRIKILHNEEVIYKSTYSRSIPTKDLIVEFTNGTLPEEFYILPSNTKSAYKI
jgi:hypothetical protein